jgi:hypothetical protein
MAAWIMAHILHYSHRSRRSDRIASAMRSLWPQENSMNKQSHHESQTITVAELCEALATGTLPAEVEDDMYVIRNPDLLRLTHSYALKLMSPRKMGRSYYRKAS